MIGLIIMTALGTTALIGQPREIDPGTDDVIVCPGPDPRCPAAVDPVDGTATDSGVGMDGDSAGSNPGSRESFLQSVPADRILFESSSPTLTRDARTTLDAQAQWLRDNPQVRVTIEGHADRRGTREDNLALGQRRAEAARLYLEARGIASDRMQVISWGKERPDAVGEDEDSDRRNRRVVVVVPQ